MSTYRTIQLSLAGSAAVLYALYKLSHRFPDVGWLQHFHSAFPNSFGRQELDDARPGALADRRPDSSAERATVDMGGFQLRGSYRPAIRETNRRRANLLGGLKLILLGMVLPIGYGLVATMTFREPGRVELGVVIGAGIACVGGGNRGDLAEATMMPSAQPPQFIRLRAAVPA